MKRALNFFLWTTAILVSECLACTAQPPYPISGHLELHPEWKSVVYLIKPRHFKEIGGDFLGQVVDSATIAADGQFHFTNLPQSPAPQLMMLVVQRTGNRFANHLEDPINGCVNYIPVIIQSGSTLSLDAKVNAFQYSCTIDHPSADQQALLQLSMVQKNAQANYHAIAEGIAENDTMILEREKNFWSYADQLMQFADSTSSLYAALMAIRWISPAGDYERMPEFLQRQCTKWSQAIPEHQMVEELCALSHADQLPVMIGDTLPDDLMPMVQGDTLPLHQLLGKKLTIVDIWASWCAPCRKENKMILVPLWNQYKDQGLQILGYSIDNDRGSWQRAIEKDEATWTHASHLTGDETPFLKALRITTIPANYILDEHGKVLAKNVYGAELTEWVEDYLQHTK